MNGASLRDSLTEAIRYWEPRRLLYNAVLSGIVILYFALSLPGSKSQLSLDFLLGLFLLAVLANVAYCAAYIVDIFAQSSGFREQWRNYRWILLVIGMIFAGVLTRFFAKGMFFGREIF
jgi:hypothetical protein